MRGGGYSARSIYLELYSMVPYVPVLGLSLRMPRALFEPGGGAEVT